MIAEAWASYRERVVPVEAGEVQVEECRRAFYAGASAAFYGIMAAASPGPELTAADDAMAEKIDAELRAFAARVATMEPRT